MPGSRWRRWGTRGSCLSLLSVSWYRSMRMLRVGRTEEQREPAANDSKMTESTRKFTAGRGVARYSSRSSVKLFSWAHLKTEPISLPVRPLNRCRSIGHSDTSVHTTIPSSSQSLLTYGFVFFFSSLFRWVRLGTICFSGCERTVAFAY